MDPGPHPTDAEMDAGVARLRDAGLLTIGTDADGNETRTLTPEGVQVARQLTMGDVRLGPALRFLVVAAWIHSRLRLSGT